MEMLNLTPEGLIVASVIISMISLVLWLWHRASYKLYKEYTIQCGTLRVEPKSYEQWHDDKYFDTYF